MDIKKNRKEKIEFGQKYSKEQIISNKKKSKKVKSVIVVLILSTGSEYTPEA